MNAILDSADNYFSQEVQLLGKTDTVSWVAGVYYGHETGTDFATGIAFHALSDPFSVNTFLPRLKNTSIAGFVQVNWTFAPDWRLTAGARSSRDYRRIDTSSTAGGECAIPAPGVEVTPPGAALCPQRFADTFRKPSWLISLDRQFTPDILAYARIARGYRSGGQHPQSLNAAAAFGSFKPEIITEYELGLKSELLDRSHGQSRGLL